MQPVVIMYYQFPMFCVW